MGWRGSIARSAVSMGLGAHRSELVGTTHRLPDLRENLSLCAGGNTFLGLTMI